MQDLWNEGKAYSSACLEHFESLFVLVLISTYLYKKENQFSFIESESQFYPIYNLF